MKLQKIFCEVRFQPSFLFEDGRTRNEITKELKPHFPQFEYKNDQKVFVFFNQSTRTNCQIYHDRIVVDIDEPVDVNKIKSVGSPVIPAIMRRMEVGSTIRIGVRAQFSNEEIQSPVESSKKISSFFLSKEALNFLEGQSLTDDIEPKVSFKKVLNHEMILLVNIGYIHKIRNGVIDSAGGVTGQLQGVSPLTDLDIINMSAKEPSQINGVLGAACTYLAEIPHTLWKGTF